jgi:hypothetical protein
MNSIQLQLFPELPTGTSARSWIQKQVVPVEPRDAFGTQVELEHPTQLPLFPELQTGTTALPLILKQVSPVEHGTCAGTQMEQKKPSAVVPYEQADQQHKGNGQNTFKTTGCAVCSSVPVANPVSVAPLNCESFGRQP